MRIKGYDFEVAAFDTHGEAVAARDIALEEQDDASSASVVHVEGGLYAVQLTDEVHTWYL